VGPACRRVSGVGCARVSGDGPKCVVAAQLRFFSFSILFSISFLHFQVKFEFKLKFKSLWLIISTYFCEVRDINSEYTCLYIYYLYFCFISLLFLFSPFFPILNFEFKFKFKLVTSSFANHICAKTYYIYFFIYFSSFRQAFNHIVENNPYLISSREIKFILWTYIY
jgi:hypothetical protein